MKGQSYRIERFSKASIGLFLGAICGAIIAYFIPDPDLSGFGESIDFMEGIAAMGAGMAAFLERILVVIGGAFVGLLIGLSIIYKRPRSLYKEQ